MKLATAAKEFAVPRNTSSRKAAEYSDDNRSLAAYKRNSALGFANEKKFTEHILKLQHIGYGLNLVEAKRTGFKFVEKLEFILNLVLRNVRQKGN
jgi:hypothetical protein